MPFPTFTGTASTSGAAYNSAVNQYDMLFGACPSGLVDFPSPNTAGNTGYSGAGGDWTHVLTPQVSTGISFFTSGDVWSELRGDFEYTVNQLSGGMAGCAACTTFTSGNNFADFSSIGYALNVSYDVEMHAIGVSGYSNTGDAVNAILSELPPASMNGGDPSGITNVCGWNYSSATNNSNTYFIANTILN